MRRACPLLPSMSIPPQHTLLPLHRFSSPTYTSPFPPALRLPLSYFLPSSRRLFLLPSNPHPVIHRSFLRRLGVGSHQSYIPYRFTGRHHWRRDTDHTPTFLNTFHHPLRLLATVFLVHLLNSASCSRGATTSAELSQSRGSVLSSSVTRLRKLAYSDKTTPQPHHSSVSPATTTPLGKTGGL